MLKANPFCTNKPCVSSEPARSSEEMNLKDIESLNPTNKEFFLVSTQLFKNHLECLHIEEGN